MPMLRLLIPMLAGILFYGYGNIKILISVAASAFIIYFIIKAPLRSKLLIKGVSISSILFITGYMLCFAKDIRNKKEWFGNKQADQYIIQLNNTPTKGEYYRSAFAEVKFIKFNQHWIKTIGTIRVQLPLTTPYSKKAVLSLSKSPSKIPDTGTRKSYAQYLANQNIFYQIKLKTNEIKIIDQPLINETKIEFLQRSTLEIIDTYFHEPSTRGLAKALLVGFRGELDKDLNTAYTNTGVVHVIAISGLHLGLIYGLLMMLFKPLQHIKSIKIMSCLIILVILWSFTLMCGATASVVRSAVMFSFLILGTIIQSKPSTGNMLAASAFVMLVFNPFLVYDIGFQLSYAAVGSLLIYNRSITEIFQPENGFLHLGWSSISTSLSAQILTTPFLLFHFHQFPLIFILSNIIAVPLSSIALLLLILVCMVSTFPSLASPIAYITEKCIWLMNDRIVELSSLPFSKLDNIPFTGMDLLFSLISIGIMTVYFREKNTLALKTFLITLLLWAILYHYSS